MPISPNDWRLMGQEKYLKDVTLVRRVYRPYPKDPSWDHDHCAFCSAKFMVEDYPDVLHEGYSTEDEYYWICEDCFHDFREYFGWKIIES
jgi:hypothetical protein